MTKQRGLSTKAVPPSRLARKPTPVTGPTGATQAFIGGPRGIFREMEPVKLAASEVLDPVAAVHLADRYPRLPDGILPEQAVSTTHIQSGFRATASMPTYISAWPPPDFPPPLHHDLGRP